MNRNSMARFGRRLLQPDGLFLLLAALAASCGVKAPPAPASFAPGISHTNYRLPKVPWSIHVVRVDRSDPALQFHSTHGRTNGLWLSTLTDQINSLNPALGTPLAAVNGDYYQMAGRPYAGDPRGLQIVEGELISAPIGGISFWIDTAGQPHATNVAPLFRFTWPNGATNAFGLNEPLQTNAAVLYTPALGQFTHTPNALELVLEPAGDGPWLPLRIGTPLAARVREVYEAGSCPLDADTMVLSLDWRLAVTLPPVEPGAVLKISPQTLPDLKGVQTAISGGPMLLRNGKQQKWTKWSSDGPLPYEFRSMSERHPRTALGWDSRRFYLVEVDGRQKKLSAGMTLKELADFMRALGCTEVMNLDGGGSAMVWCKGGITNSPCDLREREIANALVVVRKEKSRPAPDLTTLPPAN